jgi:DNA repair protein RadC
MKNLQLAPRPIREWAPDDRPREKMLQKGASGLTDSELLAILINNGGKDSSALDIARHVLDLAGNNLAELGKLSLNQLQKVKGIGKAKAILITAALEMGRRRINIRAPKKITVRASSDIAKYLSQLMRDLDHEVFAIVFLNRANRIKNFEIISRGGITGTVADPRIILRRALEEGATSIVLTHNHPSGNLTPSRADEEITRKIVEAAKLLDISVLDHIIVSEEGYYSFADEGML